MPLPHNALFSRRIHFSRRKINGRKQCLQVLGDQQREHSGPRQPRARSRRQGSLHWNKYGHLERARKRLIYDGVIPDDSDASIPTETSPSTPTPPQTPPPQAPLPLTPPSTKSPSENSTSASPNAENYMWFPMMKTTTSESEGELPTPPPADKRFDLHAPRSPESREIFLLFWKSESLEQAALFRNTAYGRALLASRYPDIEFRKDGTYRDRTKKIIDTDDEDWRDVPRKTKNRFDWKLQLRNRELRQRLYSLNKQRLADVNDSGTPLPQGDRRGNGTVPKRSKIPVLIPRNKKPHPPPNSETCLNSKRAPTRKFPRSNYQQAE